MIQVILLILKIIGITLLAILCLLLFVLALVLFVPVFYKVKIVHNPQKTQVKARVSFLFPLLQVCLDYTEKISYAVRIFGISLLDSEKAKTEKRKEKKQKAKSGKKKSAKPEKTEKVIKPDDTRNQDTGKKPERTVKPGKWDKQKTKDKPESKRNHKEKTEHNDNPETKTDSGKEKTQEEPPTGFFKKLGSKIKKIRNTISSIRQKTGRLLRQKDEFVHFLKKTETKRAVAVVWQNLKRLLKHILPRKIKGYVAYGADNPATTGQVIGLISVLYAKTGKLLELRPNFEEKQLEADVELKGRIQVFTLLLIAGKVFFNKELRQAVKEVKNIKETE